MITKDNSPETIRCGSYIGRRNRQDRFSTYICYDIVIDETTSITFYYREDGDYNVFEVFGPNEKFIRGVGHSRDMGGKPAGSIQEEYYRCAGLLKDKLPPGMQRQEEPSAEGEDEPQFTGFELEI